MFDQTFALSDLPKVFFIALLELSLAAYNAIIIALLIERLAHKEKKPAFLIGIISASMLRLGALFFVDKLTTTYWALLIGSIFLLFLTLHYFFHDRKSQREHKRPHLGRFLLIVALIELVDLGFALDSILAALAFINPAKEPGGLPSKLWIVYLGSLIGVIGIRYGAELFHRLMKTFPKIKDSTYLMTGWISLWLLVDGINRAFHLELFNVDYSQVFFWAGIVAFFMIGLTFHKGKIHYG